MGVERVPGEAVRCPYCQRLIGTRRPGTRRMAAHKSWLDGLRCVGSGALGDPPDPAVYYLPEE